MSAISGWLSPAFRRPGKILEYDAFPGFPILHIIFTSIANIERSRLIRAAEEHERTSTVGVEQYRAGRRGDGQVGRFERLREIMRQDQTVGQVADPSDADL